MAAGQGSVFRVQPSRSAVKEMPPSRTVMGIVTLMRPGVANGEACHLLSCHHLAPLADLENAQNHAQEAEKVQKRRCTACGLLEQQRPPIKTLLIRK